MAGFAEGVPTKTITLNKKAYELGFTLGAMKRARDLGVLDVDVQDETALMLALPEYVWACLDDTGRTDLSVPALAELMHPKNVRPIAEAIGELFKASMPDEDPSGNAQPAAVKEPTAGQQTSSSSGQLASTTSA